MQPMMYPVLVLIVVLVIAVIAFIADGKNTRLLHRVEGLGGPEGDQPESQARSIRIAQRGEWRWVTFLARLVKIPVDLPGAKVIPPIWIVLLGVLAMGATIAVGQRYLPLALAIPIGVAICVITQRSIFGWELNKYQAALQQQLPDAIEMVVSAIRAGLPVGDAFRALSEEMPSPTKDEFVRVVNEMSLGIAADKALLNVHNRTRVTEYAIFAVTISVQTRSGGRLVESVQKLAETVRYRLAMVTRAKALAGEARVSAIILGSLPFVAGAGLSAIRPGYLDPLFNDPRGNRMLVFAGIGLLLGILTMRRMIKKATAE